VGSLLLVLLVLMAVFAPYLSNFDPTALAPAKRTRAPSAEFWFGTDMLGRDIYSSVIYGARVSLIVGFSVALLASLAGLMIGLVSGFVRWAERVMDGMMSIPPILMAVALMALTRGSVQNVVIAITLAEIPCVSRLVRGVVLKGRRVCLCGRRCIFRCGSRGNVVLGRRVGLREVHGRESHSASVRAHVGSGCSRRARIDDLSPGALRPVRKRIQVVFQDPFSSLTSPICRMLSRPRLEIASQRRRRMALAHGWREASSRPTAVCLRPLSIT
jgi:hypothetical protein